MATEHTENSEIDNVAGDLLQRSMDILGVHEPLPAGSVNKFHNFVELFVGYIEEQKGARLHYIKQDPDGFVIKNLGEIRHIIDNGTIDIANIKNTPRGPEVAGRTAQIREGLTVNVAYNLNNRNIFLEFDPELPEHEIREPILDGTDIAEPIAGMFTKEDWEQIADIILGESRNVRIIPDLANNLTIIKSLYGSFLNHEYSEASEEDNLREKIARFSAFIRSKFYGKSDIPLWALYFAEKAKVEAGA